MKMKPEPSTDQLDFTGRLAEKINETRPEMHPDDALLAAANTILAKNIYCLNKSVLALTEKINSIETL